MTISTARNPAAIFGSRLRDLQRQLDQGRAAGVPVLQELHSLRVPRQRGLLVAGRLGRAGCAARSGRSTAGLPQPPRDDRRADADVGDVPAGRPGVLVPRHGADDVNRLQRDGARRLVDDPALEDDRPVLAGYGGQVPGFVLVLVPGTW